ncbi:hypothetical protein GCM10008957_50000 [Deinococcus ruber]|uniref:Uncharacterized protein n=1 Tax=Deinococcus ruber TaxID=1848197 RepID=A0A918CP52_9DEIO|nr:hypothetical protein GCM10008957_50000 [Deinococcus ruber]
MSKTVHTTSPYCAVQCNVDLCLEGKLAVRITPPASARLWVAQSVKWDWPRSPTYATRTA